MIITDLEVRCCSATETVLVGDTFRGGYGVDGLDFLVLTLQTDAGIGREGESV